MKDYIQWGNLHLDVQTVYLLVSFLVAFGTVYLKLGKAKREEWHLTWNAALLSVFVWKLSYFLLHPVLSLKHPVYLLYFSGGKPGILIGAAAALAYVFLQLSKSSLSLYAFLHILCLEGFSFFLVYGFLRAFLAKDMLVSIICLISSGGLAIFLSRKKNRLFPISAVLVLLLALGSTSFLWLKPDEAEIRADAVSTTGLRQGNVPPDFALKTLDGKKISLSHFKGKTVFLNFWASWCPPCQAEMPEMEKFYKENRHQQIEILSVHLTSEDSVQAARAFTEKHRLTFPVLLDKTGTVSKRFRVMTLPTTFVISPQGKIVQQHIGPLNREMMASFIQ
ncbi:TlpA disulfide reductase family protein [Fictibacillus fluitans]|uniref:TlpA disulfide reductase family protein n=1 Tax=Fictibacillus fluitans TaxID=3058422 RepID=A0ABT8HZL0_9BACL|nr:TlpA disulfide reductase family protein [Fictibacillus sp. NE201]MDN4526201.1 TlpA disulfide reductase family protein [Fictibacillus sp. NE201]